VQSGYNWNNYGTEYIFQRWKFNIEIDFIPTSKILQLSNFFRLVNKYVHICIINLNMCKFVLLFSDESISMAPKDSLYRVSVHNNPPEITNRIRYVEPATQSIGYSGLIGRILTADDRYISCSNGLHSLPLRHENALSCHPESENYSPLSMRERTRWKSSNEKETTVEFSHFRAIDPLLSLEEISWIKNAIKVALRAQ